MRRSIRAPARQSTFRSATSRSVWLHQRRSPPRSESRVAARGPQDSAGAYPAYLIRYRRGLGAGLLGARFPAPAGPDSLMARGDAVFRAHVQPAFDAAAAAAATTVASAAAAAAAAAEVAARAGRPPWLARAAESGS